MTALAKLSAEDIEKAIEEAADNDAVDIFALGESILSELKRRLASPKLRGELSSTVLLQLGRDVMRAKEVEQNRVVAEGPDETELSEIIAAAGLPKYRKLELVRAEILRVTGELDHLKELRDTLE